MLRLAPDAHAFEQIGHLRWLEEPEVFFPFVHGWLEKTLGAS